jgi:hypothetical protein
MFRSLVGLLAIFILASVGFSVGETYKACVPGYHMEGGTCPGPSPTNPNQCVIKQWAGDGCEDAASGTCSAFGLELCTARYWYGTCVNGSCQYNANVWEDRSSACAVCLYESTTGSTG